MTKTGAISLKRSDFQAGKLWKSTIQEFATIFARQLPIAQILKIFMLQQFPFLQVGNYVGFGRGDMVRQTLSTATLLT